MLSAGRISVTTGLPLVTVPVLSSTTVFALPASSSERRSLEEYAVPCADSAADGYRNGCCKPQGARAAITSTLMPLASAKPKSLPAMSQPITVTTAIVMTDGTNTAETLSAILAMGAFVAAASATILIICERVVSSPTLEASHLMKPERLTVPAETKLPSCLSTGRLSPVSADSSTALVPSMTVPSTGMLSPGRTTKISPFCTPRPARTAPCRP